ncbi:MAG: sodium-dependent transporter [Oscillospiraceae bacterium]|nr:sodium-dependent transporter [Oscillospiraceae bacterium]
MENKNQWGSSFGFVMASVGAALGLGNIWGFPYKMGESGCFAFLVFYLAFVLFTGFPVLLAELAIGRRGGESAPDAYGMYGKSYRWAGRASIAACMLILSYYCFFGGMVFQAAAELLGIYFGDHVFWSLAFIAVASTIVFLGVQKGIENFSKVVIPLLILMLLFVVIHTLSSPIARGELVELMTPKREDFNIRSASSALAQVFFSMSLGQGCMLVCGAYQRRGGNLAAQAIFIPLFDTLTAVLAAFAILPAAAVKGIDPGCGPSLLFDAIPKIFGSGRSGALMTLVFFTLVLLAALTSVISMIETPAVSLCSCAKLKRPAAVALVSAAAFLLGLPVYLSYGQPFSWLNVYEFIAEYLLIILVSVASCAAIIFVGKKNSVKDVFGRDCLFGRLWLFVLKYITPILLLFVILSFIFSSLIGKI